MLDHPTATEVYGYVQKTLPSVSRATVFRVLGGFVGSGRAQEVRISGGEARYDCRMQPHYHARCVCCERVVDIFLSEVELFLPKLQNFAVEGYRVELYGRCKECNSTKKEENRR